MDSVKEKTTVLYPPVGPGGGQSLPKVSEQSIAEEVDEHKTQEEDLLEKMRRFSDPAYLHTVTLAPGPGAQRFLLAPTSGYSGNWQSLFPKYFPATLQISHP